MANGSSTIAKNPVWLLAALKRPWLEHNYADKTAIAVIAAVTAAAAAADGDDDDADDMGWIR